MSMDSGETAPLAPQLADGWKRRLLRTLCVVMLAMSTTWLLNRSPVHDESEPAGFVRGVVHGATMPLALPNLLFGVDATIYADKNTGRVYKLGYTVGVNGCGALFFGFVFWRVSRWRRKRREERLGA